MTAVTLPTRSSPRWREAAAFAWRAWTAVPHRRWAWVLAVGAVVTLIGLPQRVDLIQKAGWHPLPAVADTLLPLLASLVMFLGWVLADAGSDAWRDRRTRLLYALLASAAAATLACVFLWYQSGAGDLWAQVAAQRGKAPKSVGLMLLADYINMVVVGGMIYAVAELLCQRARTQRDFEATVRQQVSLEHQVLESRLSAMQAQVEPRFLFDTLVDIEALYARDPQRAADNLDRLTADDRRRRSVPAEPLLSDAAAAAGPARRAASVGAAAGGHRDRRPARPRRTGGRVANRVTGRLCR